jgi:hypothetical protein
MDEGVGLVSEGLMGAVENAGALVLYPVCRRRWDEWGTEGDESTATLPGDGDYPELTHQCTRAITINAPPSAVWPWLLQIGQNRGGFYSFRLLEDLVGCAMPDLKHIDPALQIKAIGDLVYYHPKAPPDRVTALERERHLRIGKGWSFVLQPLPNGATRLLIRSRGPRGNNIVTRFGLRGMFDPIHFVMERRMLQELKELAEHNAS